METRNALKEKEVKQMIQSRLDEMLKCQPDLCKAFNNVAKWSNARKKSFGAYLLLEIAVSCLTEFSEGKKIEDALDSVFTSERVLKLISFATKEILIPSTEVEEVSFLDETVDKIMNGKF